MSGPSPVFVYSERYLFLLPPGEENIHSFDGAKYQRTLELLAQRGLSLDGRLEEPAEVTREQLELVHDASYLDSLTNPEVIAGIMEVRALAVSPIEVLEEQALVPMRLATGGTIQAASAALESGAAVNLSGGYHHAKRASGEGFCVYSDLGVAVEVVRARHGVERVMLIDLDVHQGNGVETIFKGDDGVEVFDIYNEDIYPWRDPDAEGGIRWNHPVSSGTGGEEYLGLLRTHLPGALEEFRPDLLLYNAGTDVFTGDPLGELELSEADVLERDRFVWDEALRREIPIAMVPSGGYTDDSHRLLANALEFVFSLSE